MVSVIDMIPYLCSTMTEQRLNSLVDFHDYMNMSDELDLKFCLNAFVSGSEHKSYIFGCCC